MISTSFTLQRMNWYEYITLHNFSIDMYRMFYYTGKIWGFNINFSLHLENHLSKTFHVTQPTCLSTDINLADYVCKNINLYFL